MAVHVVVGRKLRLDVRDRDETPQSQQQTCAELREVEFPVDHREVVAVIKVMAEQLIARQTVGGRIAAGLAVDRGKPEAQST